MCQVSSVHRQVSSVHHIKKEKLLVGWDMVEVRGWGGGEERGCCLSGGHMRYGAYFCICDMGHKKSMCTLYRKLESVEHAPLEGTVVFLKKTTYAKYGVRCFFLYIFFFAKVVY